MSPWWLKPPADDEAAGSEGPKDPENGKTEEKGGDQPGLDLAPASVLKDGVAEEPAETGKDDRVAPESDGEPDTEESTEPAKRPSRRRSRSRGGAKAKAVDKSSDKADDTEEGKSADDEPEKAPSRAKSARRPAKKAAKKPAKKAAKKADKSSPKSSASSEPRPSRRKPAPPRESVAREAEPDVTEEFHSPVYVAVSESGRPVVDERRMAMFCDLENIALGVRDSDISKFELKLVLERLLEKGKIIVKRAYADWERYKEFKRSFHEAGVEMIDIPQKHYSGKNSADIKMVVDAMEFCWAKEHLDTFVLMSGDSDFTPLVGKLKENNKHVIGVGVKNSSSRLLIDNCDEFIFYEDVWRDEQKGPALDGLSHKSAEVFRLLVDSTKALMRENKDVLWGSMVKQTMQRKRPSFNEGYYGYSSFSDLLKDAEAQGILELKRDGRSGSYIITGL